MKKIAFAFLAAMAVLSFGCKKKDAVKEAMAKMEGFKAEMCKCKAGDKACAEKVAKDMQAYGDSMKGKEPDPSKVSEADKKKMGELAMEMGKCQMTAMGAGDTMAPPPPEPKKDEPKMDEPKKDEPKMDEPKKDEPKKEEPKK